MLPNLYARLNKPTHILRVILGGQRWGLREYSLRSRGYARECAFLVFLSCLSKFEHLVTDSSFPISAANISACHLCPSLCVVMSVRSNVCESSRLSSVYISHIHLAVSCLGQQVKPITDFTYQSEVSDQTLFTL